MSGFRIEHRGLIDRSKKLNFTFDGKDLEGFAGDTLASALLANGVKIVGRSFKYHRPRGFWGAWVDDPNAPMDVEISGQKFPNCPATTTCLEQDLIARSVNAWPSAERDVKSVLNWMRPFLPAGFYYKTFMWPDWHLFEPSIRKMAGLGNLDPQILENYSSDQIHENIDTLIIGAGPTGLKAANLASKQGKSVLLVDDQFQPGGSVYRNNQEIDGLKPEEWVAIQLGEFKQSGGRLLTSTTAFGIYDHNLIGLAEQHSISNAPRLWRVRAQNIILATGAIDRPVTFVNNDRPGIMSLEAGLEFLGRYGVLAGKNIIIYANHKKAEQSAKLLEAAGAGVQIIKADAQTIRARGNKTLQEVRFGETSIKCDAMLVSGGPIPLVHLWRHAGGKLAWNEQSRCFIPDNGPSDIFVIGAANGTFDLDEGFSEAESAVNGKVGRSTRSGWKVEPLKADPERKADQWVDFQHDVTLKDIELAKRENYVSVEHLKRYTTLGMASDQGKTSNIPALEAMANLSGKSIPEVGTTTFRPPFVPIPMELYRGTRKQQLFNPLKRLTLEEQHRKAKAALGEYGGWLRPGWYGKQKAEKAIKREVLGARNNVAISDASPLGKIEVMGPDAEKFVNFIFYNNLVTQKPGQIRYVLMLTERGTMFDDGVITRLAEQHYLVSCSSSHVDAVRNILEAWRQDGHDPDRIFIHDLTHNWATITISGPKARALLEELELGIDLSAETFPHMSFRQTTFEGQTMRIARVSFTGDLSFELSIANKLATELWRKLTKLGKKFSAIHLGVEALSILRAEKGYIIIGKDTDGETMPHDIGFGIPRRKKKTAYIGDRSLHTPAANSDTRRQLVGLELIENTKPLETGAHLISGEDENRRSIGFVTSSYFSPTLNQPIALALLEQGQSKLGETVLAWHNGKSRRVKVVPSCFFDPESKKLNA